MTTHCITSFVISLVPTFLRQTQNSFMYVHLNFSLKFLQYQVFLTNPEFIYVFSFEFFFKISLYFTKYGIKEII